MNEDIHHPVVVYRWKSFETDENLHIKLIAQGDISMEQLLIRNNPEMKSEKPIAIQYIGDPDKRFNHQSTVEDKVFVPSTVMIKGCMSSIEQITSFNKHTKDFIPQGFPTEIILSRDYIFEQGVSKIRIAIDSEGGAIIEYKTTFELEVIS